MGVSLKPRIHGLTVCVDYHAFLLLTGQAWLRGLSSLTVVTSPDDLKTVQTLRLLDRTPIARQCPLRVFVTDAFTRDGAAFNKGLAMEEARQVVPWEDWILFFDIDILPEPEWAEKLGGLQMGYLYGAWRHQVVFGPVGAPTKIADDCVGYGYFQLFHSKSPSLYQDGAAGGSQGPRTLKNPLLDTQWKHAGNYDSNFMLSFRPLVREVPIFLGHIGPQHENWFGVGHKEAYQTMMATRNGLGIQDSEKIDAQ